MIVSDKQEMDLHSSVKMTNVIDAAMNWVSKRRASINGKMHVCSFSRFEHCEGGILGHFSVRQISRVLEIKSFYKITVTVFSLRRETTKRHTHTHTQYVLYLLLTTLVGNLLSIENALNCDVLWRKFNLSSILFQYRSTKYILMCLPCHRRPYAPSVTARFNASDNFTSVSSTYNKQSYACMGLDGPSGLQEAEASFNSRLSSHEGARYFPAISPRDIAGTHIC
jgi:hypothetical protein